MHRKMQGLVRFAGSGIPGTLDLFPGDHRWAQQLDIRILGLNICLLKMFLNCKLFTYIYVCACVGGWLCALCPSVSRQGSLCVVFSALTCLTTSLPHCLVLTVGWQQGSVFLSPPSPVFPKAQTTAPDTEWHRTKLNSMVVETRHPQTFVLKFLKCHVRAHMFIYVRRVSGQNDLTAMKLGQI